MGGIADYSGSLVLQRPIAESTVVTCELIDQPVIEMRSAGRKPVTFGLAPLSYGDARNRLLAADEQRWAAYVTGVFLVLMHERNIAFRNGARLAITSTVPAGKGVASSAALEVATMEAVTAAFGISVDRTDKALLCQQAENLVAGAPCGVMDQMTSVFGEADALMALLCQPAELQASVRVPEGLALWGIDSGERHSVGGSDYASVRTGAFMGHRIITTLDPSRDRYLANISPADFEKHFVPHLPEEMRGATFLARYGGTIDTLTKVIPGRTYKIRRPTGHPIYENDRVQRFRDLLRESAAEECGDLMYQSHASYSACGLGSKGTDLIVNLVRAAGPKQGLHGARITGGGSGGTVAILGCADARDAILKVAAEYTRATGHRPYIFSGSSNGASVVTTKS
jgi:L-arabinokinase